MQLRRRIQRAIMSLRRRNAHNSRAMILVIALFGSVAAATPPVPHGNADAPPTPDRVRVTGTATIRGKAQTATIRWSYVKGGKTVESAAAPKMTVTRLSSNVPLMMIKLPSELFAIRIGEELNRTFDQPILLDNKGEATCSCRMRKDCGSADTAEFRCRVEGWLED